MEIFQRVEIFGGVPNPLEIYGDHSFIGDRALGYYHW